MNSLASFLAELTENYSTFYQKNALATADDVRSLRTQKSDFSVNRAYSSDEFISKKKDPLAYLDAKIIELQESIPEKIIKASDSINQKNGFDQLQSNSLSYSIIIGSIVNIYGNCVRRYFQIESMNTVYEYVYTFFYRLGFNCICSFIVSSPKAEQLNCGIENYFTTLRQYSLDSGVKQLTKKVTLIVIEIC